MPLKTGCACRSKPASVIVLGWPRARQGAQRSRVALRPTPRNTGLAIRAGSCITIIGSRLGAEEAAGIGALVAEAWITGGGMPAADHPANDATARLRALLRGADLMPVAETARAVLVSTAFLALSTTAEPIRAHGAIGLRITPDADPGAGVARPHFVTLIEGSTDDGVGADTDPALTGIRLRASIAVVADRVVGDGVTQPGVGIAALTLRTAGGAGARVAGDWFAAVVDDRRAFSGTGLGARLGGAARAFALTFALPFAVLLVISCLVAMLGLAPVAASRAAVVIILGAGLWSFTAQRTEGHPQRQRRQDPYQTAPGAGSSKRPGEPIEPGGIHGQPSSSGSATSGGGGRLPLRRSPSSVVNLRVSVATL
jgi:hypothetical protein